jgi:hypothetical protein
MSFHLKVLARLCGAILLSCTFSDAACPTATVIVKGRAENPPSNATVRVELVYLQGRVEDSADTTLENGTFTVKVPFYTQSRAAVVNGLFEKCNRKPKTVNVSLVEGDHEYDRVSLDLAKDFITPYPSAYTLRSQLVLHGPPASHTRGSSRSVGLVNDRTPAEVK